MNDQTQELPICPDLDSDPRFTGSSDAYLKADDFEGRSIRVEIDTVTGDEFMQKDRETGEETATWKLILGFKGKEKKMVVSWGNQKTLKKAFGPKTAAWIGKEIILSTTYYDGIGKNGFVVTPAPSADPNDDIPF